jgi:hypothetical protein
MYKRRVYSCHNCLGARATVPTKRSADLNTEQDLTKAPKKLKLEPVIHAITSEEESSEPEEQPDEEEDSSDQEYDSRRWGSGRMSCPGHSYTRPTGRMSCVPYAWARPRLAAFNPDAEDNAPTQTAELD